MSKEVCWTKLILEEFIANAMLTDEEEQILRFHCAGRSRVWIADAIGCSLSTVDRCIARLKRKYDAVQRYNCILPPRTKFHNIIYNSVEE